MQGDPGYRLPATGYWLLAGVHILSGSLQVAAPDISRLVKGLKTPEEYFRIVIAAPENPYQQKATELLAGLQPAPGGK